MKPVIAFYAPYHGAGKTTAAMKALEVIQSAEIRSFAEPIKRAVDAIFPQTAVWSDVKKKDMPVNVNLLQFTPREAMIAIGEAMKELDHEVWVKLMEDKINSNCSNRIVTVIDDLRFPQEYDMLWGRGAKIIKICRPCIDAPRVKFRRPGFASYPPPSKTEGLLECKYFHAKVINDCSLEEFEERVAEVVNKL